LGLIIGGLLWYWFRPELLFVNAQVMEQPPIAAPEQAMLISTGEFHSVAHESRGKAAIYRLEDGRHVLRLSEFATSNGPAVHVYLIAANDAADSAAVKAVETIDLGKLKGNIGDQNYELPDGLDMARFHAVTIWCQRFDVNFATAPLRTLP
jgi:hypothetical protein